MRCVIWTHSESRGKRTALPDNGQDSSTHSRLLETVNKASLLEYLYSVDKGGVARRFWGTCCLHRQGQNDLMFSVRVYI
jgi:hypothetical protein